MMHRAVWRQAVVNGLQKHRSDHIRLRQCIISAIVDGYSVVEQPTALLQATVDLMMCSPEPTRAFTLRSAVLLHYGLSSQAVKEGIAFFTAAGIEPITVAALAALPSALALPESDIAHLLYTGVHSSPSPDILSHVNPVASAEAVDAARRAGALLRVRLGGTVTPAVLGLIAGPQAATAATGALRDAAGAVAIDSPVELHTQTDEHVDDDPHKWESLPASTRPSRGKRSVSAPTTQWGGYETSADADVRMALLPAGPDIIPPALGSAVGLPRGGQEPDGEQPADNPKDPRGGSVQGPATAADDVAGGADNAADVRPPDVPLVPLHGDVSVRGAPFAAAHVNGDSAAGRAESPVVAAAGDVGVVGGARGHVFDPNRPRRRVGGVTGRVVGRPMTLSGEVHEQGAALLDAAERRAANPTAALARSRVTGGDGAIDRATDKHGVFGQGAAVAAAARAAIATGGNADDVAAASAAAAAATAFAAHTGGDEGGPAAGTGADTGRSGWYGANAAGIAAGSGGGVGPIHRATMAGLPAGGSRFGASTGVRSGPGGALAGRGPAEGFAGGSNATLTSAAALAAVGDLDSVYDDVDRLHTALLLLGEHAVVVLDAHAAYMADLAVAHGFRDADTDGADDDGSAATGESKADAWAARWRAVADTFATTYTSMERATAEAIEQRRAERGKAFKRLLRGIAAGDSSLLQEGRDGDTLVGSLEEHQCQADRARMLRSRGSPQQAHNVGSEHTDSTAQTAGGRSGLNTDVPSARGGPGTAVVALPPRGQLAERATAQVAERLACSMPILATTTHVPLVILERAMLRDPSDPAAVRAAGRVVGMLGGDPVEYLRALKDAAGDISVAITRDAAAAVLLSKGPAVAAADLETAEAAFQEALAVGGAPNATVSAILGAVRHARAWDMGARLLMPVVRAGRHGVAAVLATASMCARVGRTRDAELLVASVVARGSGATAGRGGGPTRSALVAGGARARSAGVPQLADTTDIGGVADEPMGGAADAADEWDAADDEDDGYVYDLGGGIGGHGDDGRVVGRPLVGAGGATLKRALRATMFGAAARADGVMGAQRVAEDAMDADADHVMRAPGRGQGWVGLPLTMSTAERALLAEVAAALPGARAVEAAVDAAAAAAASAESGKSVTDAAELAEMQFAAAAAAGAALDRLARGGDAPAHDASAPRIVGTGGALRAVASGEMDSIPAGAREFAAARDLSLAEHIGARAGGEAVPAGGGGTSIAARQLARGWRAELRVRRARAARAIGLVGDESVEAAARVAAELAAELAEETERQALHALGAGAVAVEEEDLVHAAAVSVVDVEQAEQMTAALPGQTQQPLGSAAASIVRPLRVRDGHRDGYTLDNLSAPTSRSATRTVDVPAVPHGDAAANTAESAPAGITIVGSRGAHGPGAEGVPPEQLEWLAYGVSPTLAATFAAAEGSVTFGAARLARMQRRRDEMLRQAAADAQSATTGRASGPSSPSAGVDAPAGSAATDADGGDIYSNMTRRVRKPAAGAATADASTSDRAVADASTAGAPKFEPVSDESGASHARAVDDGSMSSSGEFFAALRRRRAETAGISEDEMAAQQRAVRAAQRARVKKE